MPITFRAAYWTAEDCSGSVRLTTEDQAGLPDEALMAAARAEADATGLQVAGGEITIGDWTE